MSVRKGGLRKGMAITGSMVDPSLPVVLRREMGLEEDDPLAFDYVSIQFALHYACDAESTLRALFVNLQQLLRPGGQLLVTSTDPYRLARKVRDEGPRFGNDIYAVQFPEGTTENQALSHLGVKYNFTLSSAVEQCEEYVLHIPSLQAMAKSHGMELKVFQNFGR